MERVRRVVLLGVGVAVAFMPACSAEPGRSPGGDNLTASGGGGGVAGTGGVPSWPPAASFGRVTVGDRSDAVPNTARSFFGSPRPKEHGGDLVRLTTYLQGDASGPPRVEIAAGDPAHLLPDVVVWFALDENGPFTREYWFDEALSPSLFLRARLTYDNPASFYEYEFAHGTSSEDDINSFCWVTVTQIGRNRTAGSIECRDLFATGDSADFAESDVAPPRASMTILFDAVPEVIEGGSQGSGGAASAGGAPSTGGVFGDGGAASAGHCAGSATRCSLLSNLDCLSALGCREDRKCDGRAESCYSQFDSFSCQSQPGCSWSSSAGNCGGFPSSCGSQFTANNCESLEGCRWEEACSGISTSCSSLFSEGACTLQPGCYWVP